MTKLDAQNIVLFATNTGELYETHKRMAREGASKQQWFNHVRGPIARLYNRQVERVCWWPSECFDAAGALKAYYERHITEDGVS